MVSKGISGMIFYGLVNKVSAIIIIVLMVTVVFGVGDVGGGQPSEVQTLAFIPGIAHNVDTGEQFITIQEAIDDASTQNGHTIEVGAGTYIENVVIDKAITLIGEDKETTVINGGGIGTVVQISIDWVNISGFTITESAMGNSGILLWNVQHCNVQNIKCSDNKYGIFLLDSENNTLSNNMMLEDGIFIRGDLVEHWNTHSIDDSNTVNGNPVYYWKSQTGGTIPSDAGQVILANCTNVVVEDQDVSNTSVGIRLGFSSSNSIKNNNVSNNQYGISLHDSYNNNITNNNASNNYVSGISLRESSSNNITNNNVSYNDNGIYLFESNSNNIINNTVISNNSAYGIYLSRSYNNILSNNMIIEDGIIISGSSLDHWNTHSIDDSNTVNGKSVYYWKNQTGGTIPLGAGQVILANCTNVVVEDQDVSNTDVGIQLGFSSSNTIKNNNASNNNYGIYLYLDCDGNDITNNTVSNNDYGIRIFASDSNTIYHNDIIGNTIQAYDKTGTNFWNAPYPIGGNYWSDYPGNDFFSGPDQNILGSDGIGDTPYTNIGGDAGAQDNYPLVPSNFLIPVIEGWNFISTPLIPFDTSIPSVLTDLDGDTSWTVLQYYDASDPANHWKTWAEFKPSSLNDLSIIDYKMGVWLYIPVGSLGDGYINVTGFQKSSSTINLMAGWNLVGYPARSDDAYDVDLLKGDCPDVLRVEGFNPSAPYLIEELAGDYVLKRGEGCWVYAEVDCTWDIGW